MDFEMKITAIAPWMGSKRTLAPIIVEELGAHSAYWELGHASLSVLLVKPPCSMETVTDLHGDIHNLARVIQHQTLGPKLYRQLRRALNSQEAFLEARAVCNSIEGGVLAPNLDRARDYFLTSWQGMNGMAGTKAYSLGFARRMTKNGGHAARRFSSVVSSIPAFRRRLREVCVLRCCMFELAKKIEDAVGVSVYVDPPYITKGQKYLHDDDARPKSIDSAEWIAAVEWAWAQKRPDVKAECLAWHKCLADRLNRLKKTRVVISYYADPLIKILYPGWTIREVYKTKSLVSQGRRDAGNDIIAPEILIINGPSLANSPTP